MVTKVLSFHETINKIEDMYIENQFNEVIRFINENKQIQNNSEVLFILANCYLNLGNKEIEALQILEKIELSHDYDKGKVKNLIGSIYCKIGNSDKAVYYLQEAIAHDQNNIDAKFNLAIFLEKNGDFKKARIYLDEIIQFNPKHYNSLVHLGVIEAKSGDYNQAAEYLIRARHIKNTDPKVSFNLANLLIKQGKFEEASSLLEDSIEKDPNNVKSLQKYMVCMGKLENYEKVETISKNILAIDKSNSKALAYLSRALKENNKFTQLEKLLTKIDSKMDKLANKSNKTETIKKIKLKLKEKLDEVKNLKFNETADSDNESNNDKEYPLIMMNKLDNEENKNLVKYLERYNLDNNDIETLFDLGNYYYKINDYENSYTYFTKLQEVKGRYKEDEVNEKLGYINFANQRWIEAKKYFEIANSNEVKEIILVKIGRCCEKLKQYNEALVNYLKSIEISKNFLWGLFYLGLLYIKIGKRDEGIKYLKLSYENNKQYIEINIKYSRELLKDKDEYETAINILTNTLKSFPDNFDIILLLSKAYDKKELYNNAIEILEKAITHKDFKSNVKSMLNLGMLYEKSQNYNKAINVYKTILTNDHGQIVALCHLASILSHAKEYKRAIKYYKHALSIDENLSFAHFGIGKIYQVNNLIEDAMMHYNKCIENDNLNKLDNAKQNFQKSLLLKEDYSLALIGLGNVYFEEGNYQKAEDLHRKALKIDPNDIQAIISLAYSLSGQKKYESAIEQYIRALDIDSELSDVHYNLGNAYYMLEKYDEAIKYYIKSIKLNENRAEVFYNLGNTFCIKENYKDAIRCFKKSIKIDPNNFETYFNLGNSYFVIGWYKDALECYNTSSKLGYNKPDLKFAFSRVHILLGTDDDLNQAESYLYDLLKSEPNNNKYLFYYAKLKEITNKQEAIQIYKRILESENYNENDFPQAKESYNRLLDELKIIDMKV